MTPSLAGADHFCNRGGMSDIPQLSRRKAYEIAPRRAVLTRDAGLCMKAEQDGKDFIHHFLVPLDPRPAAPLQVIYVDPEEELLDCGGTITLALGAAAGEGPIAHGEILRSDRGTFLKVKGDPRLAWVEAFIDMDSGMLKRRQGRHAAEIFRDWRLEDVGGLSPAAIRAAQKSRSE